MKNITKTCFACFTVFFILKSFNVSNQAVSFLMKHLAIKFSYTISHDLFKLKIISRNTFIQYLLITYYMQTLLKKTYGDREKSKANPHL